MPGPRNAKSRRKAQAKKEKRVKPASSPLNSQPPITKTEDDMPVQVASQETLLEVGTLVLTDPAPSQRCPSVADLSEEVARAAFQRVPSPFDATLEPVDCLDDEDDANTVAPLLQRPFIEDPGTGIRVRDTHAFLASRFATPPSIDDELCAEFAQEEVLQMLCSVLPYETALVSFCMHCPDRLS